MSTDLLLGLALALAVPTILGATIVIGWLHRRDWLLPLTVYLLFVSLLSLLVFL